MSNEKKPYIVGLTGGIASGKTAATDYLQSLGAIVVDADVESRAVTAEGGEALPVIRETFGDGVFHEDGTLDRAALGAMVFADIAKRRMLEKIVHPMVQRRTLQAIREAGQRGESIVFLSVPLLYESGMDALCDETWVFYVDGETQLRRLMARDNLSAEEARRRIDSQMPADERAARAQIVIRTGRPIEQTRAEIRSVCRDLKRRIPV